MNNDPVEAEISAALVAAGIRYERDKELQPGRYSIDFYLPDFGLWIECCQYHTPRKIEQLSRLPDVILIQGMGAAKSFRRLIKSRVRVAYL